MNAPFQMPLSERIGRAHRKWVELDKAARLLDATKSAVFSQMMMRHRDKPVSRAEIEVKASEEWMSHIQKVEDARTAANHAKVELEFTRNQLVEWQSAAADERLKAKL